MKPWDGNVAGFSAASWRLKASSCCVATASVTPGDSRMIAAIPGMSVRTGDSGSQNPSLPYHPNRGGMTPTMVRGTLFRRSVLPIAPGSPSNSRSHSLWLMTTTGSAWPSGRTSDGCSVRPTTGGTPRKLKALAVSSTPLKLSGAYSPVSSTGSIEVAMTSENAGTSRRRGSSSSR